MNSPRTHYHLVMKLPNPSRVKKYYTWIVLAKICKKNNKLLKNKSWKILFQKAKTLRFVQFASTGLQLITLKHV